MSIADRLTVSRHIAAPADCIFAIVTDPRAHVAIDGSGMLVATDHATPLRAVGDTFEMDMDRAPLGDIPLDRYRVTNTVVAIVAGVEVAWTTGGLGQPSVGHVWGYHLVPVGDAATQVDHYCDWSAVSAESRERYVRRLLVPRPQPWPVVPRAMLERSLVNLERIATRTATS